MRESLILSVDQSTSGTKVLLVNEAGRILDKEFLEHRQYYPQGGWVEHDPREIYANVKQLIVKVLNKDLNISQNVKALSITNQRETVVVWDKRTGLPIYNAIVWQCRRTADVCTGLKDRGLEQLVKQKTGLTLDPYFSATKVQWILSHVDGARDQADAGHLLMGTMDTWLIWNLTKGVIHATDYSNASRTLLFNIHKKQWDEDLVEMFSIPTSMLPRIYCSDEVYGYVCDDLLSSEIPISGVIGDSQGALFGQRCFEPGMAKATYGTGSSVLLHTGHQPIESNNGLVTSIAWGLHGEVEYALEGIIHSTGDTVKWVRDNLGLFSSNDEAERLARSVHDNNGVYLIPAFMGLGAPYWDPFARAAIVGVNRNATKAHVIRAAFESIAYQIKDAMELMHQESNLPLTQLRVDGGATKNQFLMQFQSDLLGVEIIRSEVAELSAMGSVYIAGIGIGIWGNKTEVETLPGSYEIYRPRVEDSELFQSYYMGWQKSVGMIVNDSLLTHELTKLEPINE